MIKSYNGMDIHFLITLKYKLAGQLEVGGMANNGQYGLCSSVITSPNYFWIYPSKWYT